MSGQSQQYNFPLLDESSNEFYVFDATTLKFVVVNKGAQCNPGYSLDRLKNIQKARPAR